MLAWINKNQGFLMIVLTLIYVLTTILILNSNRKSASVAAKSNKQQLALQLLDRRLQVYYLLNNLVQIANSLFVENFPLGTPVDLFTSLIYSGTNDQDIENLNKQVAELQQKISSPNFTKSIRASSMSKIEEVHQIRFMRRFRTLSKEIEDVGQIQVLFPNIDYSPIKSFCDSFFATFVSSNKENIEKLKVEYNNLKQQNTSEKLWNTIKEI